MSYFDEARSAETVNSRMGPQTDARLRQVMESLVRHLHAFAVDVSLTQEEWEYGIGFLTRTGQMCSDERQEFILLSDVLGFSMLVDAINNRRPAGATCASAGSEHSSKLSANRSRSEPGSAAGGSASQPRISSSISWASLNASSGSSHPRSSRGAGALASVTRPPSTSRYAWRARASASQRVARLGSELGTRRTVSAVAPVVKLRERSSPG